LSEGSILIVDDDAQLRRVLRVSLTAHGYEVGDVRSGEEALSNVRSEHYDMILLDINLPGMNGIDVCRALRSRPHGSESAIIMLSVRKVWDGGCMVGRLSPFRSPQAWFSRQQVLLPTTAAEST
jgi:DNA-binding response OmpR family regulator